VARLERGNALVTAEQVRTWCGSPATTSVVVTPVIDLDACTASSAQTASQIDTQTDSESGTEGGTRHVSKALREHLTIRDRTCVFPWCTRPARGCATSPPCDADHIHPRGRGGPTCSCNLALLCRRHHRLKTHTPWTYRALGPGTYAWTSPHGYHYLRDPYGTTDISRDRSRPPDD
jgi:hypothetical protein